jgi:hypothetical protein
MNPSEPDLYHLLKLVSLLLRSLRVVKDIFKFLKPLPALIKRYGPRTLTALRWLNDYLMNDPVPAKKRTLAQKISGVFFSALMYAFAFDCLLISLAFILTVLYSDAPFWKQILGCIPIWMVFYAMRMCYRAANSEREKMAAYSRVL